MIEVLRFAEKQYKKYGDRYFLENCKLSDGIYIKISENKDISDDDILIVNKKTSETDSMYNWFKERDFYSRIIYSDANKVIENIEKKILSTNPFSLVLNRKNLPDKISGLSKNNTKKYDLSKLSKNDLFNIVLESHYLKLFEISNIDYTEYMNIFKNNMEKILAILNKMDSLKDETRIKIFLDLEASKYKNFYDLYYIKEKGFLDNHYNALDEDGNILGAMPYSSSLNQKKPLLRLLDTAFVVPYRISVEDSALCSKMFISLNKIIKDMGITYKTNKDNEVINYELLASNQLDSLKTVDLVKFYEVLQVENHNDIPDHKKKQSIEREKLRKIFDTNFCYGCLEKICKAESKSDISDANDYFKRYCTDFNIFTQIVFLKDPLNTFFYKNSEAKFGNSIYKLMISVFLYELRNINLNNNKMSSLFKLRELLDLIITFTNFLDNGVMGNMDTVIKDIIDNVHEDILYGSELLIKDDNAFYYLSGQLAYYIVNQSASSKKNGQMIAPFINISSYDKLKRELTKQFGIYGHAFSLTNKTPFMKLFNAVLSYEPQTELRKSSNHFMLMAGLTGDNIIYKLNIKEKENKNKTGVI